ncbi:MAG: AI-2E family transporter [Bacteroidetes bacterium]|nr:AI-2E family transporter [Bacteroidota bacterium]
MSTKQTDLILRWIQRPSTWVPLLVFIALVVGFAVFFPTVASYLVLGLVLALMAHPVYERLRRVNLKGKKIPKSIASILSLASLMVFFLLFWLLLLPLLGYQFSNWQRLDSGQVVSALEEPIGVTARWLAEHGLGAGILDGMAENTLSNHEIALQLQLKIMSWIDVLWLGNMLGNFVAAFAGLVLAFISGFFIAFFLLKDKDALRPLVIGMVPKVVRPILLSSWQESRRLLTKYFNGLLLQWMTVFVLEGIGLWLVGLNPALAISIAIVASLFNVVPYLGPILGSLLGLILGLIAHVDASFYDVIWPILLKMALVFFLVQQVDGYVLQPLIFSSSLNIHPLEIFLITFIGAQIAGFYGLIFAVPGYTVVRVVVRQSWSALSREWKMGSDSKE